MSGDLGDQTVQGLADVGVGGLQERSLVSLDHINGGFIAARAALANDRLVGEQATNESAFGHSQLGGA